MIQVLMLIKVKKASGVWSVFPVCTDLGGSFLGGELV